MGLDSLKSIALDQIKAKEALIRKVDKQIAFKTDKLVKMKNQYLNEIQGLKHDIDELDQVGKQVQQILDTHKTDKENQAPKQTENVSPTKQQAQPVGAKG